MIKTTRLPWAAACLAVSTSLLPAQVLAGEASFTLSNKSVYMKVTGSPDPSRSNFGAGYLYHKGSRHVLDLNGHAQGQTVIGNYPTTTGIGVKALFFKQDDFEGQSLGLGGYAAVNIPEVPGLSAYGSLHYAPAITSFADADGVSSLELEGRYRVIQNADVKVGYRHIKSELENDKSLTLDSGVYLGLSLHF